MAQLMSLDSGLCLGDPARLRQSLASTMPNTWPWGQESCHSPPQWLKQDISATVFSVPSWLNGWY